MDISSGRNRRRKKPRKEEKPQDPVVTNSMLKALIEKLTPPTPASGVGHEAGILSERGIRRRVFMAEARRLPEGDAKKEKVMAQLGVTGQEEGTIQTWTHKSIKENFQKWLAAPGSAAPFEFSRIFKSLGYTVDLTKRNLSPAVPVIMVSRILAEEKNRNRSRE